MIMIKVQVLWWNTTKKCQKSIWKLKYAFFILNAPYRWLVVYHARNFKETDIDKTLSVEQTPGWDFNFFYLTSKICQFGKTTTKNVLPSSFRSSHLVVFLGKDVLKICSKFTGEHPCRNYTSPWVFSCIFSENIFLRTPFDECFLSFLNFMVLLLLTDLLI